MIIIEWIKLHQALFTWLTSFSILIFFGSLIGVSILIVRMPADYFLYPEQTTNNLKLQHPVIRLLTLIIKNLIGYLFIIAGIAMLVLPGQGIITIFIGLTLIDFPHKRDVERRIIQQPGVIRTINWMRSKRGKSPLMLSELPVKVELNQKKCDSSQVGCRDVP